MTFADLAAGQSVFLDANVLAIISPPILTLVRTAPRSSDASTAGKSTD